MRIIRTFYYVLKYLWLTVWTLYQLVLGLILVAMVYGAWQLAQYLHFFEIRNLETNNPKTTAFMESERTLLADSVSQPTLPKLKKQLDTVIHYRFIPLDSIPKTLRELALVAEDAKFYSHSGFDLEEIEYALVANHQQGKKARGASTISQQVAKNLFLSADKEMTRKLREAAITVLMEQMLGKDRILELYLNIAQFDRGVFGVSEGALRHYGKPLNQLTPEEQLGLVCVLPSPAKWSPKKSSTAYLLHKRRVVGNYALYKGIRDRADTTRLGWVVNVYDSVASRLSDDKWNKLRTGSGLGWSLDTNTTTSSTDSAIISEPAPPELP